jgi:transmembrane sensor
MTPYPNGIFNSPDDPDYSLLERYWLKETSEEETAQVEAWFAENPSRRTWFEQIRRGLKAGRWVSMGTEDIAARTDAIFEKAGISKGSYLPEDRPAQTRQPLAPRNPVTQSNRRAVYLASVAAFAAIMLIAGWTVRGRYINANLANHASTYTTANGERATITLPDGSTVTLNVGSQLHVPANFATGNRTVQLAGEAFFTVNSHAGSPFTVIAGPSTTRVLGTQFVVRYYVTDTSATVAVREGKVMVQSSVLTGAQQIQVGKFGVAHSVEPASPHQFTFAAGILTLPPMSMADAIAELNRWYNTDIQLADASLRNERISGQFPAGSISDLSAHLEWLFNVRVVREGRILTLHRRS